MKEACREFLLGMGSIFLGPVDNVPMPEKRITLPPDNFSVAIAHDFGQVASCFRKSMDTVEHAEQLELNV